MSTQMRWRTDQAVRAAEGHRKRRPADGPLFVVDSSWFHHGFVVALWQWGSQEWAQSGNVVTRGCMAMHGGARPDAAGERLPGFAEPLVGADRPAGKLILLGAKCSPVEHTVWVLHPVAWRCIRWKRQRSSASVSSVY
jgi:hypothetical protein